MVTLNLGMCRCHLTPRGGSDTTHYKSVLHDIDKNAAVNLVTAGELLDHHESGTAGTPICAPALQFPVMLGLGNWFRG
jgi:hypothetical protein